MLLLVGTCIYPRGKPFLDDSVGNKLFWDGDFSNALEKLNCNLLVKHGDDDQLWVVTS